MRELFAVSRKKLLGRGIKCIGGVREVCVNMDHEGFKR